MSLAIQQLPDFVIPNGATVSNIVPKNAFEDAWSILMFGPAAIVGGGTLTIQVTTDDTPTAGGNWSTLQRAAADVTAPAVTKAKAIGDDNGCVPACTGMRISGTGAVTGATTFKAQKIFEAR